MPLSLPVLFDVVVDVVDRSLTRIWIKFANVKALYVVIMSNGLQLCARASRVRLSGCDCLCLRDTQLYVHFAIARRNAEIIDKRSAVPNHDVAVRVADCVAVLWCGCLSTCVCPIRTTNAREMVVSCYASGNESMLSMSLPFMAMNGLSVSFIRTDGRFCRNN